jgi:hypothetical protein
MITDTHKTVERFLYGEIAVKRTDTPLYVNKTKLIEAIQRLKGQNSLPKLRADVLDLESNLHSVKADKIGILNIHSNGDTIKIIQKYLIEQLDKIAYSQTIERAKYYIERLEKAMTESRTNKNTEGKPTNGKI